MNKNWIIKLHDPLYPHKSGYYHGDSAYQGVSRDKAERLTHKDAQAIVNRLTRPTFGYECKIEKG